MEMNQFDKTKDLLVSRQLKSTSDSMPFSHYHNAYELYYLISGERYYFIENRTYKVDAGDLVLIKPYVIHKTLHAGHREYSHERILVNFTKNSVVSFPGTGYENILTKPFNNVKILSANESMRKHIEKVLMNIVDEYSNTSLEHIMYIRLQLTMLLLEISRYITRNNLVLPVHPSSMHRYISEIVQYINDNYFSRINLESVSVTFNISPYYISRNFKKVTGFGFSEYINQMRIKHSQYMLANTSDKITEIAYESGFESITHFERVFKRNTGISPLKYRKDIHN